MDLIKVKDKYFKPFISEAQILQRIEEVVKEMEPHFKDKRPLFVAILNGSFMLAADVMKATTFDCEIAFTRLSSYQKMSSTGNVNTVIGLKTAVEGRHLIILEDIIDSGRTMFHFLDALKKQKPTSISIFSLLYKPEAVQFPVSIDYVGFEISNQFVIGYGLDYDEHGRQYRDIYQLSE